MRVVRNAKRVSLVVGGSLVVAGCLCMWLAGAILAGPEDARPAAFAFFIAVPALIQGIILLSWDRRSEPMALMRMQASDVLLATLPVAVLLSVILWVPGVADPARPYLWMTALLLGSAAFSVVPADEAAHSEIPPLRPGGFLDWLRWQNFGAGTLLLSLFFTVMHLTAPSRSDAFTPLIVMLALVQAAVSVWRIMEHRQFAKAGLHLSGLQISWLRVIHIRRGHEAAVRELRTMYPKISSMHADTVIENLYRTEEEPDGP
jgi:hypothetical protein